MSTLNHGGLYGSIGGDMIKFKRDSAPTPPDNYITYDILMIYKLQK